MEALLQQTHYYPEGELLATMLAKAPVPMDAEGLGDFYIGTISENAWDEPRIRTGAHSSLFGHIDVTRAGHATERHPATMTLVFPGKLKSVIFQALNNGKLPPVRADLEII